MAITHSLVVLGSRYKRGVDKFPDSMIDWLIDWLRLHVASVAAPSSASYFCASVATCWQSFANYTILFLKQHGVAVAVSTPALVELQWEFTAILWLFSARHTTSESWHRQPGWYYMWMLPTVATLNLARSSATLNAVENGFGSASRPHMLAVSVLFFCINSSLQFFSPHHRLLSFCSGCTALSCIFAPLQNYYYQICA